LAQSLLTLADLISCFSGLKSQSSLSARAIGNILGAFVAGAACFDRCRSHYLILMLALVIVDWLLVPFSINCRLLVGLFFLLGARGSLPSKCGWQHDDAVATQRKKLVSYWTCFIFLQAQAA